MRTVYEVDDRAGIGRGYDSPEYGRRSGGGMVAIFILLLLLVLSLWGEDSWLRQRLKFAPVEVVMPTTAGVNNVNYVVNYVQTEWLNMRVRPSTDAQVKFILPAQTPVTLLGDIRQEADGDVWAKVSVETRKGTQSGWVQRQYIGRN